MRALETTLLRTALVLALLAGCSGADPDEGKPCPDTRCSRHGVCTEKNYLPSCACEEGYLGLVCGECKDGYHRVGFTECVRDEVCAADTCGAHGACSVVAGVARCGCETGYTGTRCDACVLGYHLTAEGACTLDETCLPTSCANGVCDDSTGVVVCTCDAPANGPTCRGSCEGDENPCVHGTCALETGYARCTCDAGYTGADCATCAVGYAPAEADTCRLIEPCTATSCSGAGTCSATSGSPQCTCLTGYTGAACEICADGFHRTPDRRCVPNGSCAVTNPCGAGADCVDTGGDVRCVCKRGYAGAACDRCYPGYHRDGTNTCVLDERCTDTSCGPGGTCEDASGVVTCTCAAAYTGSHCEVNRDDCGTACGVGQCLDLLGERMCLCPDGTYGQSCRPLPHVDTITPAEATQLGGISVDVTTTLAVNGATFSFGGLPATNVTYLGPNRFRMTVPRNDQLGTVDVVMTNPDASVGHGTFRYVPTRFAYTGAPVTFTVPSGVTTLHASVWGAGGGGGLSAGGAGGYAKADLAVTPGDTMTIVVGQGGARIALATPAGAGGGLSGIFASNFSRETALLVAGGGGGGGGSTGSNGGHGGGEFGAAGGPPDGAIDDGRGLGGSAEAGGTGGCTEANECGGNGTALSGGAGGVPDTTSPRQGATFGGGGAAGGSTTTGAGGGGGGYFGGGGGANGVARGGGGGSGFASTTASSITLTRADGATAPGDSDPEYASGIALPGAASDGAAGNGGHGRVVLSW